MRIVILGAGVIGVCSAYYLARAGHAVTVLERQAGPACETSFANSGEVSPGYSSPWAGPGLPFQALKWLLFMKHSPLIIRPAADIHMYVWLGRMLANCSRARYDINKARMVRLAEHSRDCLAALRAETGIRYDERTLGTLQLLRTREQLDAVARDIRQLERMGVAHELLDRAGCLRAEPGLAAAADKVAGGLRLPRDETGDCFLFTRKLAEMAAREGVTFRYGTRVTRLAASAGRIRHVEAEKEQFTADRYVVAAGSYSAPLLRPLGLSLPVYPVKGYSITIPLTNAAAAPVSTVMDETYKIAITRLGDRIRVGGRAEIAGFDTRLRPSRRAALEHSVTDLFPGCGDIGNATFWTGLRPMTPDGTPVVGATRYENLYLNTGHGTLGWTMACGSAQVLSDLISGRKPPIATEDLSLARYG